jgi:hypothetical protein
MESTTTQHSHVAELAWQLLKKGVPTTSPAGAFTSPLSLYVALALALRGACRGSSSVEDGPGQPSCALWCRVTRAAACMHGATHRRCRQLRALTRWRPTTTLLALSRTTGASGGTEQELYHVLHADKARLLGLVAPKDASAGDVAALLRETASLSASLAAQAGNGAELVLANGVWSKGVPVSPEYAAAVKDLFGVGVSCVYRGRSRWCAAAGTRAKEPADWPAAQPPLASALRRAHTPCHTG